MNDQTSSAEGEVAELRAHLEVQRARADENLRALVEYQEREERLRADLARVTQERDEAREQVARVISNHEKDLSRDCEVQRQLSITKDEVCIYEVEVTSHLSEEKLNSYATLWEILDGDHLAFCRLFRIDTACRIAEFDLPLFVCERIGPADEDPEEDDDDSDDYLDSEDA